MVRRVIDTDDTDPRFQDLRHAGGEHIDPDGDVYHHEGNVHDHDHDGTYDFGTHDHDDLDDDDEDQGEDGREADGRYGRGRWDFPVAKPRLPADGIRAVSQRGSIATTWWSRRFLAAIESPETSSRLSRGRSYARSGQVLSLAVTAGRVTARVQGSRRQPYDVVLTVPVFRAADWKRIIPALAGQAAFSAALLAGQLPQDIDDELRQLGVSLFPTSRQLTFDCSCPDWGDPCKHAAAVCYLLAERFDADPFTMLALRGMARQPLLAAITTQRDRAVKGDSAGPPGATDELRGFWDAGPLPQLPAPGDRAAVPVLARLGPTGVIVRGTDLAELLVPAYEAMIRREGAAPPGDEPRS